MHDILYFTYKPFLGNSKSHLVTLPSFSSFPLTTMCAVGLSKQVNKSTRIENLIRPLPFTLWRCITSVNQQHLKRIMKEEENEKENKKQKRQDETDILHENNSQAFPQSPHDTILRAI